VSFAAITLCVASQRAFIVVYFVTDSVQKRLHTPLYTFWNKKNKLHVWYAIFNHP